MVYRILADIVVLVHFLWILFLILGAFIGVHNKVVRIAHVSGLFFALLIQITDWYCPLTDLEAWLRSRQAQSLAYKGSFIIHYVEKLVYVDISRSAIVILTILLCLFNGWLYLRKKVS
jgi:hypothetical protein